MSNRTGPEKFDRGMTRVTVVVAIWLALALSHGIWTGQWALAAKVAVTAVIFGTVAACCLALLYRPNDKDTP